MKAARTSLRYTFADHQEELLDSLHQAALDTRHWDTFLQSLVMLSNSRSARLLVMDRHASRVHYSTKIHIDDDEHARYVAHFVNTCPWRPELARKPPGKLYSSRLDFSCSQRDYYRSEFFNDWARGLDIHHGLCGTVMQNDHYTVQLLIQRTRRQGHFDEQARDAFNMLVPQVRHTLRLSLSLARREQGQHAALAAAQHSALPSMIFDTSGRLLFLSDCATDILAPLMAGTGDSGPSFLLARHRRQFHELLQRASSDLSQGRFLFSHSLTLSRASLPPVRLCAMAVQAGLPGTRIWQAEAGALAVYVQDPLREQHIDLTTLSRLFGLSHGEARVAAAIARGQTPRDIAVQHGCSLHTIRSQLKTVLRKTDTHRQAELAALILRSTATLGVHSQGI